MSRLGKMPRWQKWLVILSILSCSLSGSFYLIGHEFQIQGSIFGSHHVLAIHGTASILAIIALGSVLPFHLKAGLQSKRKKFGGISQLGLMGMLIASGTLLYYGPEIIRDQAVNTHWITGLLFFSIFLTHLKPSQSKRKSP
jgi:hypothetical protein